MLVGSSMRNPAVSISVMSTMGMDQKNTGYPQFTGDVRSFIQQNEGCKIIFIAKRKRKSGMDTNL